MASTGKVTNRLELGPGDAGTYLDAAQFAVADFKSPYLYERAQGKLVVMSPAGPDHRRASRPFRRELGLYWGTHPDLIDDVDVEGWVATSADDDRLPDICVYLVGDSSGQTVPQRVPDVIFEVVSKTQADQDRDYIEKRREYHAIGVREYVIVDRHKRKLMILTWQQQDYAEHELGPHDQYTTPLLPGLSVNLSEVFPD